MLVFLDQVLSLAGKFYFNSIKQLTQWFLEENSLNIKYLTPSNLQHASQKKSTVSCFSESNRNFPGKLIAWNGHTATHLNLIKQDIWEFICKISNCVTIIVKHKMFLTRSRTLFHFFASQSFQNVTNIYFNILISSSSKHLVFKYFPFCFFGMLVFSGVLNLLFNPIGMILNAWINIRYSISCTKISVCNNTDLIEWKRAILMYWQHKWATRITMPKSFPTTISSTKYMVSDLNIRINGSHFTYHFFTIFIINDRRLQLHQNRWGFTTFWCQSPPRYCIFW